MQQTSSGDQLEAEQGDWEWGQYSHPGHSGTLVDLRGEADLQATSRNSIRESNVIMCH